MAIQLVGTDYLQGKTFCNCSAGYLTVVPMQLWTISYQFRTSRRFFARRLLTVNC